LPENYHGGNLLEKIFPTQKSPCGKRGNPPHGETPMGEQKTMGKILPNLSTYPQNRPFPGVPGIPSQNFKKPGLLNLFWPIGFPPI